MLQVFLPFTLVQKLFEGVFKLKIINRVSDASVRFVSRPLEKMKSWKSSLFEFLFSNLHRLFRVFWKQFSVGPGLFITFKMVGKMGETCPQCKQFRMLCMCAVTSDRDRKGRQGRRMSTERALAFAQSLAVWKRRSRRPRGPLAPSRQSSLRTIPNTPSMIAAGKRRITFSTTI